MDTVLGLVIVGLVLGFVLWLVSKSPDRVEGGERRPTRDELRSRAAGIAFLLEEAEGRSELWEAIPEPQRAALIRRYERELADLKAAISAPPVTPQATGQPNA